MSNLNTVMSQAAAAGTAPDGAWDLSYAYYDDPFAGDLSTAYFFTSYSLTSKHSFVTGVFIGASGSKMYTIGRTSDKVHEWNLSTPWLVSSASFVRDRAISSEETEAQDVFFKPDGTKMYIIGTGGDEVNEYDLSTAWDLSTATFNQNASVLPESTTPLGFHFKPDGTKMYVMDNNREVNEYDLSTAWDVSTVSYLQGFDVGFGAASPEGIGFSNDGAKMYVLSLTADSVFEYNLSTAWDVSTASLVQGFSVITQETTARGLFVKPDGSNMYVVGNSNNTVYQYSLGGLYVNAQEPTPTGVTFKPDGTKMYIVGVGTGTTGKVNEYSLSTPWDTSTASSVQFLSITSQDSNATGVVFKPDGTKMYLVGTSSDRVHEYNLSIAWDISTATVSQNFNVGPQDLTPQGLSFKDDGTKMYICGGSGDDVNEYNLSAAWDISTASYSQNFNVNAQEASPLDLFFKFDGTKMYIVGGTGDEVNEYDLSTAWDISTASFVQNFRVFDQEGLPHGLSFKDDGTKMFIVGTQKDKVFTYSLGVQPEY